MSNSDAVEDATLTLLRVIADLHSVIVRGRAPAVAAARGRCFYALAIFCVPVLVGALRGVRLLYVRHRVAHTFR
jgi:hypothetical protein